MFTTTTMAKGLALSLLTGLSAAVPHAHQHQHRHASPAPIEARDDTFNIELTNNCPDTKVFGIFQFVVGVANQYGNNYTVPSGGQATIPAPYNEVTMRLSGTADKGCDAQWDVQPLFEFGYAASWTGGPSAGTAYDISMMDGCDPSIGMSVNPISNGQGSDSCESKYCVPGNCGLSEAWTNPDQNQASNGNSAADTVCYKGKTDFKVVWCPQDSGSSGSGSSASASSSASPSSYAAPSSSAAAAVSSSAPAYSAPAYSAPAYSAAAVTTPAPSAAAAVSSAADDDNAVYDIVTQFEIVTAYATATAYA